MASERASRNLAQQENLGRAEIGAKVFLGGLYGSYSMVFAGPLCNRIEIGHQLSKLIKFQGS